MKVSVLFLIFSFVFSCTNNSHLKVRSTGSQVGEVGGEGSDPVDPTTGGSSEGGTPGSLEITQFITESIGEGSAIIDFKTDYPSTVIFSYGEVGVTPKQTIEFSDSLALRNFEIPNLNPGTDYEVSALATNEHDTATGIITFKTLQKENPIPILEITELKVISIVNGVVKIQSKTNMPSTSIYNYGVIPGPYDKKIDLQDQTTIKEFEIKGLAHGAVYMVQMKAYALGQTVTESLEFVVTTCDALEIEELSVTDLEGNNVEILSKTNAPAFGTYKYGKVPGPYDQVVVSDELDVERNIQLTNLEVGVDYKLILESSVGNLFATKEIIFKVDKEETPEPEEDDFFACAQGYDPNVYEKVYLESGTEDNFVGEEEGKHKPTEAYISQMVIPGQTRGLFDADSTVNKYLLAEFDLTEWKDRIKCLGYKVKGRSDGGQFNTDGMLFHALPYGDTTPRASWPAVNMYSSYYKKISSDEVSWKYQDYFAQVGDLSDHSNSNNVNMIDAVNHHAAIRFHYQDDAALDYVKLYLLVKKEEALRINKFKVHKIEGQKLTLKSEVNIASEAIYTYGKVPGPYDQDVTFSTDAINRTIVLDNLEIGKTYKVFMKAHKGSRVDNAQLEFVVQDQEPDVADILTCPQSFQDDQHEHLVYSAGSEDNFVGEEEGNHAPTPEFVQAAIIPGQSRAFYDRTRTYNQYVISEFNLAALKGRKIKCAGFKLRGRSDGGQFNTDSVSFYVTPYGLDMPRSQWRTGVPFYSYDTTSVSMTSPLMSWRSGSHFAIIKDISNSGGVNLANFIDAVNYHNSVRFLYQDDATIDYVKLFITVEKPTN